MADFYFFTDLDLIEECIPGTSGQTDNDYFGKQENNFGGSGKDRFLVSSVFRRMGSSSAPIYAYAVCKGQVMIDEHPTANYGTIVLKPSVQPRSIDKVDLPDIKYIIYRGIKYDSLVDSGPDEITPSPGVPTSDPIELRGYINQTHATTPGAIGDPSSDAVISRQLPPIPPATENLDTPVYYSFASETSTNLSAYPEIDAGKSIGEFHPGEFSIEIVFDSPEFEPDLNHLRSADPVRAYIEDDAIGTTDYELAINRTNRDKVRHFIDPSAFFGAFYSAELGVRYNALPEDILSIENGNFNTLFEKFFNRNVYYLDVRNKYDKSFNFYKYVNDLPSAEPNGTSFPRYADDTGVQIENSGGSVNSFTRSYYTNNWPLLILRNDSYVSGIASDFPASSLNGEVSLMKLSFDKGNNFIPRGYVVSGYTRGSNTLGASWEDVSLLEQRDRFIDLTEVSSNYEGLELLMPIESGATNLVPFYSRVLFVRKYAKIDDSSANFIERLYDHLIDPVNLFGPNLSSNNLVSYTYNDALYVNLEPNTLKTEFYGGKAIAVDNKNVTLSFYQTNKISGASFAFDGSFPLVNVIGDDVRDFLAEVDDQFSSDRIDSTTLSITGITETPQILEFRGARAVSGRRDSSIDDIVCFVIDKANYQQILTQIDLERGNFMADAASGISGDLPISLVVRNRSDWDNVSTNDVDDNDEPYFSFELFIQGFNRKEPDVVVIPPATPNVVDTPQVAEFATGIILYGRSGDFDHNIYVDKDTTVDLSLSITSQFEKLDPSLQFKLNVSDESSPENKIRNLISNAESGDLTKRYFLNNPDVVGYFNTFYKDDLKDFIFRLYDAAVTNVNPLNPQIKHHPSFLLYKFVFSKLIQLDPTVHTAINPAGVTTLPIYTFQAPDFTTGAVIPSPVPATLVDVIQLNFDVGNNFDVRNAFNIHQGFLLEASNALAVYFLAKRLQFISKYIAGGEITSVDSWMQDNKGAKDSSEGLDVTIPEQFYPIVREFPLLNNLFFVLADNGFEIPGFSTSIGYSYGTSVTGSPYAQFYRLFTERTDYETTVELLIDLYNVFASGALSIPGDDLYKTLDEWFTEKQNMVNDYTLLFYEFFQDIEPDIKSQATEDFEIHNISTGDGSNTVALFDKSFGTSLYSYTPDPSNNSASASITKSTWDNGVGATGAMQPLDEVIYSKSLTRVDGSYYTFHMALYGLESTLPTVTIDDKIYGYKGSIVLNPTYDFERAGKTFTNSSPVQWDELNSMGMPTGTVLGRYTEFTKDLKVYDLDIDRLEYRATAGSNETSRFLCFFRQPISQIFFAKSYQDLFPDDGFLIPEHSSGTNTASDSFKIWSGSNDPNLEKLVAFIRDSDSIEINTKGGMVGKKNWPVHFIVPTAPDTYPIDHIVFHRDTEDPMTEEEKVYKTTVAGATEIPHTSVDPVTGQWKEMEFSSLESYSQDEYIYTLTSYDIVDPSTGATLETYNITKVFRAINNVSSGGTEPTGTNADWEFIVESYNKDSVYLIGDRVIQDGRIQECVFDLAQEDFNQEKWIFVQRLQSDSRYQHLAANSPSLSPLQPETGVPSDEGTKQVNEDIRSTLGTIEYDATTNKVIINIESYASPVRSTLYDGLPNIVDQMNLTPQEQQRYNDLFAETIWGQNPVNGSDNENATVNSLSPASYRASYNQVLTALRCWGLMWAIKVEIENADATDALILNKLTAALNLAQVTTVLGSTNVTTNQVTATTSASNIDFTKFTNIAGL